MLACYHISFHFLLVPGVMLIAVFPNRKITWQRCIRLAQNSCFSMSIVICLGYKISFNTNFFRSHFYSFAKSCSDLILERVAAMEKRAVLFFMVRSALLTHLSMVFMEF